MMHRYAIAATFLAVFSAASPAIPQENSQPHHHSSPATIDGAVNPELIPDLTAFRLWLVMVSRAPVPTDDEAKRQKLQLGKVDIRDSDPKVLVGILANFHSEYHTLIDDTVRVCFIRTRRVQGGNNPRDPGAK